MTGQFYGGDCWAADFVDLCTRRLRLLMRGSQTGSEGQLYSPFTGIRSLSNLLLPGQPGENERDPGDKGILHTSNNTLLLH